jgi:hypothetical protein
MNYLKTMLTLGLCALCYGCATEQPQPLSESEKLMRETDAILNREWERMRPENIAARNKQRREAYVSAHPELPKETREDILSGGFRIGMTAEQVEASCGTPYNGVNSTVTAFGKHEQWVYGDTYLYFDDGLLTSYQNFHQ